MSGFGMAGASATGALIAATRQLDGAKPTRSIVYAGNLPAPWGHASAQAGTQALLDHTGVICDRIGGAHEAAFWRASIAGGDLPAVGVHGRIFAAAFRWICVSAQPGIGTIWQCFVQIRDGETSRDWLGLGHPYFFSAQSGTLLNPPQALAFALPEQNAPIQIVHPEGRITCLPCKLQRFKIVELREVCLSSGSIACPGRLEALREAAPLADGAQAEIAPALSQA